MIEDPDLQEKFAARIRELPGGELWKEAVLIPEFLLGTEGPVVASANAGGGIIECPRPCPRFMAHLRARRREITASIDHRPVHDEVPGYPRLGGHLVGR